MELMILFGAGFIGIMIVIAGFFGIAVRKVSAPSKRLEEKVVRLEKELDVLKK